MTHDNMNLGEEFEGLQSALSRLKPATPGISRDEMMFQAGRAAGRSTGRNVWPGVSTVLALALFVSVSWQAMSRQPVSVQYTVQSPSLPHDLPAGQSLSPVVPARQEPEPLRDPDNYLAMRDRVLQQGLDALPMRTGNDKPMESAQLLRELLGEDGREIRH